MNDQSKLAELTGIMLGDGCLSNSSNQHIIYISGHREEDFDYHNKIMKQLLLDVFDKKTIYHLSYDRYNPSIKDSEFKKIPLMAALKEVLQPEIPNSELRISFIVKREDEIYKAPAQFSKTPIYYSTKEKLKEYLIDRAALKKIIVNHVFDLEGWSSMKAPYS